MNWMVKLGNLWEDRRSVPRAEFLRRFSVFEGEIASRIYKLDQTVATLEAKEQIPSGVAKELALLKARQDRLELYVGLKREPKPVPVNGASQIS